MGAPHAVGDASRLLSRRSLLGLVATLAGGLLLACGRPRPAAEQPAPPQPQSQTAGRKTVRLATVSPFFFQAPIAVGKTQDFYAEQGIDLEILHFEGDPIALKAVLAGEADFGTFNGAGQVLGAAKGDTRIIGSFQPLSSFVIAARSDVREPRDLYGRTYATSAPGALPHLSLMALFDKAGLDLGQVTLLGTAPGPATLQALKAGKVDAGMLDASFLPAIESDGDLRVLSVLAEAIPELLFDATAATESYLRANPDVARGMAVATMKLVRYALDNREAIVKHEAARLNMDPKAAEFSYDFYRQHRVWNPDFYVSPEQVAFTQQMHVRLGNLDAPRPPERVATWDYQKQALDQLGPYRPAS